MLLFFRDENLDLIDNLPIFSWQSIADKKFFGKLRLINWQAIFLSFITSDESEKLNLAQTILAFHKYQFIRCIKLVCHDTLADTGCTKCVMVFSSNKAYHRVRNEHR